MNLTARTALIAVAFAAVIGLSGCGDARSASSSSPSSATRWSQPGMSVKVLNPGAKHLDAIVTRDTFNKLFPQQVWFEEGDVVGMYNRETRMTFLVVSQHTYDAWNDELSSLAERLCHEKAHRADDLYDGDLWSELRDTSAPGLALDTHHFGEEHIDESVQRTGMIVSTSTTLVAALPTVASAR